MLNPLHKLEDKLPFNKQYVLIHLNKTNWHDSDDPKKNRHWVVAKFIRGISTAEREAFDIDDARKKCFIAADEHNNNKKPYNWETFGASRYFGQEVNLWCELPEIVKCP